MYFIHFKDSTSYFGSACGLVERCGTLDRRTVRLNPAATNVFVSLGKMLDIKELCYPSHVGHFLPYKDPNEIKPF